MRDKWTHWDLNPGPSACEADVIPLHHVPHDAMVCQEYPSTTFKEHDLLLFFPFANPLRNLMFNAVRLCQNWKITRPRVGQHTENLQKGSYIGSCLRNASAVGARHA